MQRAFAELRVLDVLLRNGIRDRDRDGILHRRIATEWWNGAEGAAGWSIVVGVL